MALVKTKSVVILSADFAGVSLARGLNRLAKRDPFIEVHLVNQENYFVLRPMLPEGVSYAIVPRLSS